MDSINAISVSRVPVLFSYQRHMPYKKIVNITLLFIGFTICFGDSKEPVEFPQRMVTKFVKSDCYFFNYPL